MQYLIAGIIALNNLVNNNEYILDRFSDTTHEQKVVPGSTKYKMKNITKNHLD